MRQIFLAFLPFLFIFTAKAQPPMGRYFSPEAGLYIQLLPEHNIQLVMGADTIGSSRPSGNTKNLEVTYRTQDNVVPAQFDIIISDGIKNGQKEILPGIYRMTGPFSFDLVIGSDPNQRPKSFDESGEELLHLLLDCRENYVTLLQLNAKKTLAGFVPETSEVWSSSSVKEITYLQNGVPLQTDQFQTKEIRRFDEAGRLIHLILLDENGEPFETLEGYSKLELTYTTEGKLGTRRYYARNNGLMLYNGGLIPETRYTYVNGQHTRTDYLINNPAYLDSVPVTHILYYDRFGELTRNRFLYHQGQEKPDTLQQRTEDSLNRWIGHYARYPESFKPILYGDVHPIYSYSPNRHTSRLEDIRIYAEFELNNSLNQPTIYSGFFTLNPSFTVKYASPKTEPGITNPMESEMKSTDMDNFRSTYWRELTEEEKRKMEEEKRRENEEMLQVLNRAFQEGTITETTMSKKEERQIRKMFKKLEKQSKKNANQRKK